MDAQERLRRLRGLGVTKGIDQAAPPHRRHGPAIQDLIEGELIETELGRCFVSDQAVGATDLHGGVRLARLLGMSTDLASRVYRDPSLATLDFSRAIFVDTETTGLSGGTGTVAFLVGIGYYAGDEFRVRQYFMRDFPEEPSMLKVLAERLDRFEGVVSFNGKAFDMPLLATRFRMARIKPRLSGAPHWDLLFPSRRLWRERLESCALKSLEVNILGLRRTQADVTGGMIPQLYFDYLRTGNAQEMARVFYHNANDIASLAALSVHILELLDSPHTNVHDASDLCSLGRLYEDADMREHAHECYLRALACSATPERRESAQRRLARSLKRAGRREEARELWSAVAANGCDGKVDALVELAIDEEHRRKDYSAALECVSAAVAEVSRWPGGAAKKKVLSSLRARESRLHRKLERARQRDA